MFAFGVKRYRLGGEEARGRRGVSVGVVEETWGVEGRVVVAVRVWGVGDEFTGRVEAMVGFERCREAWKEDGVEGVVVGGGGAVGPDEVGGCVGDEEEGLRRGAEEEGDEVLAGAGGGSGDDGGGEVVVEMRETEGVVEEGLGWGRWWGFVE